jgi:hypothetical protein
MPAIPGLESINWFGFAAKLVYWLGWGLIIIAVLALFFVVYYFFSFKYKVFEIPIVGSGTDQGFSVGKTKTNRFKWNRRKMAWRPMKPYFNKIEIEPFDERYIYHGNVIYAFKLGEHYIPGCVSINRMEDAALQAEINPVPYYIRNWQSMKHKQHEMEFAKHDWWSDNKAIVYMLITVAACLGLAGLTVYLTFQFAAPSAAEMGDLANAIRGLGENVIS